MLRVLRQVRINPSNGKCERYNGTLKKVLKKLCITYEKDWDEMLSYALFAYRETPHE